MAKKDFTKVNTGSVYGAIDAATAEPAPEAIPRRSRAGDGPTQHEIDLAREQGRTQGRKGCKAIRINMAFDPDVHDFIRTMARARGQSVTAFTNDVFRDAMARNAELYERAQSFVEDFN